MRAGEVKDRNEHLKKVNKNKLEPTLPFPISNSPHIPFISYDPKNPINFIYGALAYEHINREAIERDRKLTEIKTVQDYEEAYNSWSVDIWRDMNRNQKRTFK